MNRKKSYLLTAINISYGFVDPKINIELYGNIGFGPPNALLSSPSSLLSINNSIGYMNI